MTLVVAGMGLILDRLIKTLALKEIVKISKNQSLFFFDINQRWLIIATSLIIAVLSVALIKERQNKSKSLSMGYWLIILGGLSNLFDRIVYGYVIDTIPLFSFSVFNLADVMVISGSALILIKILDFKKARDLLNWFPKVNLDEGLKKTFEWYNNYLNVNH